ncbi:MAG: phosphoenolpyruvate-utilizing N-terminal domain-containing protein [Propionibacteriaceae bacterium]|nr:phosphoenolpyruvate-utilizing N-terminal domain-containing protein [Propionibacteriaceae bacterium]
MTTHGIGVSPGTAVGPTVVVSTVRITPPGDTTEDPALAEASVSAALEAVAQDMDVRAQRAPEAAKAVLEATATMARDPGLLQAAAMQIAEGHGPVDALHHAVEQYCGLLASLGGYMAERQEDLRDVFQRAGARLMGLPAPGVPTLTTPSVLVALDLAPADTATLDPAMVLGIVTEGGGVTSHTAILAAQLGIPAVVQAPGVMVAAPASVGLDGSTGEVVFNPSDEVAAALIERNERRVALQSRAQGPGRTRDGQAVQILANIGTVDDALRAAAADVEGSGLFRSEFLFLDRAEAPSVDEQVATYTKVFEAFGSRKVVVRTLDAGADKPLAFADLGEEENPALGVRGLRLQRVRTDLLDDQLIALARAREATGADVWVMAPMVATAEEAGWFTHRCRDAGLPMAGTMVEVPAAAIRSANVLAVCDFASIGTNDLSQYLFAADRMQGRLAPLLDGWQPALWDLIVATVRGAGGKPVGICGEVAGDPLLALVAVGAGITSLSMAVGKVGSVKAALAMHDAATCLAMLEAVLSASSPEAAKAAVLELVDDEIRSLLG